MKTHPLDCGLVFIDKTLRYFTSYKVLRENGKHGTEFIRVTFPDGTTGDIHEEYGKDRVIPAIEHIHRYPEDGGENEVI